MQLPELRGHTYEDLLGEDPFGWSFVTSFGESERRVVKVLKSQATSESLIGTYFQRLSEVHGEISGAATVYDYTLGSDDSPAAYSMPFYGWKSKESTKWQLTSLKRLMHLLPKEQAEEIIRKLAVCVSEVHEAGLFHGGIKLGDIFLTGDDDGNQLVKLADFGQIFMGGLQYLEAGELLFYVSPEQLETGDFSDGQGQRWDVYSFGVVAFQLLTGHLPRLDRLRQQCLEHSGLLDHAPAIAYGGLTSTSEHFLKALEEEKPVEWPDSPSDEKEKAVRAVIENCLEFDQQLRPDSMREVADSLKEALKKVDIPTPRTEPIQVVQTSLPVAESENEAADLVTTAASPSTVGPAYTRQESDEQTENEISVELTPVEEVAQEDAVFVPEDSEEVAHSVNIGTEIDDEMFPRTSWVDTTKNRVREYLESHPELKWKVGTIATVAALIPLLLFAAGTSWELRQTERERTIVTAELQANVEQQAEAYRRVLTETRENEEQLETELNEVEGSRSRLMGEAKLARQILRQTQDNGDEFFRLVL
ncbi:MAG: protein kinase, partial [Verrucomicrobiota bacterium]